MERAAPILCRSVDLTRECGEAMPPKAELRFVAQLLPEQTVEQYSHLRLTKQAHPTHMVSQDWSYPSSDFVQGSDSVHVTIFLGGGHYEQARSP